MLCFLIFFLALATPVLSATHSTEVSTVVNESLPVNNISATYDQDYGTYSWYQCGGTPCSTLYYLENYTYNSLWEDPSVESDSFQLLLSTYNKGGSVWVWIWNYTEGDWDLMDSATGDYLEVTNNTFNLSEMTSDYLQTDEPLMFRHQITQGTSSNSSMYESTLYWDADPYVYNCTEDPVITFYGFIEDSDTPIVYDFDIDAYIYETEGTSNYSINAFELTGSNNYSICISPEGTYYLDATVRYIADGYAERHYYLDQAEIDPDTETEINLYLLNSSDSTTVSVRVLDPTNNPEEDILVLAQKQDIGQGTFTQVVMGKSDFNGYTYMNFDYNQHYKFYLMQDGTILREYNPFFLATTSLTFYVSSVAIPEYFSYYDNVATGCTFNETSRNLTCSYVDSSGLTMNMTFEVVKYGITGTSVVYSNFSTSSSGSWIYHLDQNNSYGYTLKGTYYSDPTDYVWQSGRLDTTQRMDLGLTGVLLATILVLLCSCSAYYDPKLALVITPISIGATVFMGLISLGSAWMNWIIIISVIGGVVAYKL